VEFQASDLIKEFFSLGYAALGRGIRKFIFKVNRIISHFTLTTKSITWHQYKNKLISDIEVYISSQM